MAIPESQGVLPAQLPTSQPLFVTEELIRELVQEAFRGLEEKLSFMLEKYFPNNNIDLKENAEMEDFNPGKNYDKGGQREEEEKEFKQSTEDTSNKFGEAQKEIYKLDEKAIKIQQRETELNLNKHENLTINFAEEFVQIMEAKEDISDKIGEAQNKLNKRDEKATMNQLREIEPNSNKQENLINNLPGESLQRMGEWQEKFAAPTGKAYQMRNGQAWFRWDLPAERVVNNLRGGGVRGRRGGGRGGGGGRGKRRKKKKNGEVFMVAT